MKLKRLNIGDEINRRVEVINLLARHKQHIGFAAQMLYTTINKGGRVFVAGNGGSGSLANHFATELIGHYKIKRPSLDVRCLSDNGPIISGIATQFGFSEIYTRQLGGQFQTGDAAIFFVSGFADNASVINAITDLSADQHNAILLGVTGSPATLAKAQILIDSDDENIVQECHLIMTHIIFDLVERKLQQEPESRFLDV